jgi:hypothetical protein
MRVIFTHTCQGSLEGGGSETVVKGVLGQVVAVKQVSLQELLAWVKGGTGDSDGAALGEQLVGCVASGSSSYRLHPGATQQPYYVWPVVEIVDKRGCKKRLLIQHMRVKETRWKKHAKATVSLFFLPLFYGYAVNSQGLQGVTFTDPKTYLLGDITEAHWLQGCGGVMISRSTDLDRVLLKPPAPAKEWVRQRRNWFKVDRRVLDWLSECRKTAHASGNAGIAWDLRAGLVKDKLKELGSWTLERLASAESVMQAEAAQFAAAGGWEAVAFGAGVASGSGSGGGV